MSEDLIKSRSGALIPIAVAIVTLVAYLPTLRNGFIAYDDPDYVTGNARVLSGLHFDNIGWIFTTPVAANWHPLTWLSHMLDVSLFGTSPAGHHFTSVLLHAISAGLLCMVLMEMTAAPWRSAAVAMLFAIHPLRAESVAWVSERKDVLSGLLFMLTLWQYVRYVRKRIWRRYVVLLVLFSLGLMAKQMLVTVPIVLLLLDYWPLARWNDGGGKNARRLVLEKLPLLVLSLAASVVVLEVQAHAGAVAKLGNTYALPNRLTNAVVSYVRYLGKMFWPTDLAVFYPHPGSWPAWEVVASAVVLVLITTIVMLLGRRRNYLFVGWFWFLIMLLPVIGIVQVGWQSMADRYMYLPGIGLSIIVVFGGRDLIQGCIARAESARMAGAVLAACAGCALLYLTEVQITYWQNTLTLFTHALDVTHDNYLAHGYVGSELAAQNKLDDAIAHFSEAVRIFPAHADAQANWGNVLMRQGHLDEAIEHFKAALAIRPEYAQAHNNLAIVLAQKGDFPAAEQHFAAAVRANPSWDDARANWAAALAHLGRIDEAAQQFQIVLQHNPNHARARAGMERILAPRHP
jgi:tetratricopeptide (TPR) repeat protein